MEKARPIIEPFFQMPGWKHKRVEYEIARADEIGAANSQKAREAADRRWAKERADKLGEMRASHAGTHQRGIDDQVRPDALHAQGAPGLTARA